MYTHTHTHIHITYIYSVIKMIVHGIVRLY